MPPWGPQLLLHRSSAVGLSRRWWAGAGSNPGRLCVLTLAPPGLAVHSHVLPLGRRAGFSSRDRTPARSASPRLRRRCGPMRRRQHAPVDPRSVPRQTAPAAVCAARTLCPSPFRVRASVPQLASGRCQRGARPRNAFLIGVDRATCGGRPHLRGHADHCRPCRQSADRRRGARPVGAVLPLPAAVAALLLSHCKRTVGASLYSLARPRPWQLPWCRRSQRAHLHDRLRIGPLLRPAGGCVCQGRARAAAASASSLGCTVANEWPIAAVGVGRVAPAVHCREARCRQAPPLRVGRRACGGWRRERQPLRLGRRLAAGARLAGGCRCTLLWRGEAIGPAVPRPAPPAWRLLQRRP